MKKQFARVICLCLALVITLGSVGMAATEQICLMAVIGNMPVKPKADTCCAKKKAEKPAPAKTKLGPKCCINTKQYHKLQTPAAEKPCAIKIPVILPVERQVAFLWVEQMLRDALPNSDNNKSPPLFGTELLKTLHQFLV
ncbi:hypothetical protein [Adhaeribacter pallidiroseus]|uniref:Uncharacterized protein n=1 Tax=Adhaeribacter pallidiroseus TaxID=2072847 RepID=A0A369QC03_9BACT|nr:hypothetical protein [Adhaeribacter pallidiroseus]RDC62234.1 hypothetical protein AHMF7616_00825 [Adhaeribacter pallidiroseus]